MDQPGQLRLYVAGAGQRTVLAEANVRRCCETHFPGQYHLEIIDLRQDPELARREQITALPTLVRQYPAPRRCMIGTLSDENLLLHSLAFSADY